MTLMNLQGSLGLECDEKEIGEEETLLRWDRSLYGFLGVKEANDQAAESHEFVS